MKLSELMLQGNPTGDFGKLMQNYAERAKKLENEIEELKKTVDKH